MLGGTSNWTIVNHKYLINSITQSWNKGFAILDAAHIARPVSFNICQVDYIRRSQNKTPFDNMTTTEEFIAALEDFYIGPEMRHEALLAFQNCACGENETLSEFLTTYSLISSEHEMLTGTMMSDRTKMDSFCRALGKSQKHATTVQYLKASCQTYAAMMAYVQDKTRDEAVYQPKLQYNTVTKQITRAENTTPMKTHVLQSARLGPKNTTQSSKNPACTLETYNVFNFRAYKNRCTKCGSADHLRYPSAKGPGCPRANDDNPALLYLNENDTDFKDSEDYTDLYRKKREERGDTKNRQQGSQQVAHQSRLQGIQFGPSPQMQARIGNIPNNNPKNALARDETDS
jgi:hypothetical protein